ncbi:MAG: tetratricopeptide repeat protein [Candidatus Zixiibacteriota bacterium]
MSKLHRSGVTWSVVVVLLVGTSVAASDYVDFVKKGNQALKSGDHKGALESYHAAEIELPESPELEYNMAGALHVGGAFEEAVEKYTKALNSPDPDIQAQSSFNLGNTYYRMQDYQKAIASYQQALEMSPDDIDAKFNLELARKMLKEQMKPQQQEQDQKQQQEEQQQEQQEQPQDQDEKDDQQQDQNTDQQNKDENKQNNDKQEQSQKQQSKQEMSKEDAERILNALRDDEQDVQKKIRRARVSGSYSGKDW